MRTGVFFLNPITNPTLPFSLFPATAKLELIRPHNNYFTYWTFYELPVAVRPAGFRLHHVKNRVLMGSMHTGLEEYPDGAEGWQRFMLNAPVTAWR